MGVTVSINLNDRFSDAQEAEAASQRRKEAFYPPYTRLVSLIRGRVRYPNDYDSLHPDEQAEFKRARYAVGDTLLDAAGKAPLRTVSRYFFQRVLLTISWITKNLL